MGSLGVSEEIRLNCVLENNGMEASALGYYSMAGVLWKRKLLY